MTAQLLILSDLHLGIPGVTHPGDGEAAQTDRELVAFLRHYQTHRIKNQPWRLIINGDMMEFMRAAPPSVRWSEEDLSPIFAALDQILSFHREFFCQILQFLGAGHEVIIVRGNHDAELHLPAVARHFRQRLAELGKFLDVDPVAALGRLRLEAHAYHEEGLIHVEHGHMYDSFSAWDGETENLGPENSLPLGTHLIRDLCNHFGSVNFFKMETWSFWQFLRWFFSKDVPWRLVFLLPWIYGQAVARLLWGYTRRLFQRGGQASGGASAGGMLAQLRPLWVRPGNTSLRQIAGAVHLDKVILAGLAVGAGWALAESSPWLAMGSALGMYATGNWALSRLVQRYHGVKIAGRLRRVSRRVARRLGVSIVVFGHTHFPEMIRRKSMTYVNLGNWLSDHSADTASRRFFNRFVFLQALRRPKGGLRLRLRLWCRFHGASPFAKAKSADHGVDAPCADPILAGWLQAA